ncbi:MAG: hypothetical protein AAB520_03180 [Patescibacteria group bacterium]
MKIGMNSELSKETFIGLYYQYKEFIVPIAAIVISVLLIFIILIPQISSFSVKKAQRDQEMVKLNELNKVASLVVNANQDILASNLSLATGALPTDKDFESILNTMSAVANSSNVSISSYQFSGDDPGLGKIKKIPTLNFDLNITASPEQGIIFMDNLYKAFPLSEIISINSSSNSTRISLSFYYKPFQPVGPSDEISLREMNNVESAALKTISEWNNFTSPDIEQTLPASPSAESNGPF